MINCHKSLKHLYLHREWLKNSDVLAYKLDASTLPTSFFLSLKIHSLIHYWLKLRPRYYLCHHLQPDHQISSISFTSCDISHSPTARMESWTWVEPIYCFFNHILEYFGTFIYSASFLRIHIMFISILLSWGKSNQLASLQSVAMTLTTPLSSTV